MIISRTPHRISFFGGGTDYPDYYLKHGGKVIGTAIDKYCYLSLRELPPYFEFKHRVVYSKMENVKNIDEIVHPSARETLKYLNIDFGVTVHHEGDIPARSGMGSSSAFTVGLLHSLYALKGKMVSREELTREAIYVEQKLIKESVGSQDQTFAAHGGFNIIEFLQNGEIFVEPIIITPERLSAFEDRLMLFFTGLSRTASDIACDKIKNIPNNNKNLSRMKELVDDAYKIIINPKRNLSEFGDLMNETWELKKRLSEKVSTSDIEKMYSTAIENGAIGGKLCGAGGGGFMLLYVLPRDQQRVKEALKGYLHVPFKFDFDGSKIIVYKPS